MNLPILAHSDLTPECRGRLMQIIENNGTRFYCHACKVTVSLAEVIDLIMHIDFYERTCTQCGSFNRIEGDSMQSHYVCRRCKAQVSMAA
jgi:hypothetical protein